MEKTTSFQPLSRRGFLLSATGAVSFVGVMRLLSEAGLLAQSRTGNIDPQKVFEEAVNAALREGEVGLQFAVYKDGKLVVDAWG